MGLMKQFNDGPWPEIEVISLEWNYKFQG